MKIRAGLLILVGGILFLASCSGVKETQVVASEVDTLSQEKQLEYYYTFIEANKQKILGNYTRAVALFYQCLEIDESAAAAMYEISNINLVLKNQDVALKYAKKAVEEESDNKWFNLHLAKLHLMNDRFEEAVPIYERVVEISPDDMNIKFNLAGLYQQVEKYEESIAILNEMEEKVGVVESLCLTKQQMYWELGERNKAYNEMNKLIKHFPFETRYYGLLAELYTEDKKYELAEAMYNKVFEIDSTNTIGQISIIELYRKQGDYDKVFSYVDKIIESPTVETNSKIVILVSFLNNQSEFNKYYKKIDSIILRLKEMYPDQNDMYTIHADYYIKNREYEKAADELEYVVNNQNFNLVIWDQLISIYGFIGNFEKMYDQSKVAIDSVTTNANLFLYNGIAAIQLEKYQDAVDALSKGLNVSSNDPMVKLQFYTYLGEAYHNLENPSQSDYYFEKVLRLDPNNMMVLNNYSYYLSLRGENLDKAEKYSKKTVDAEPTNSTYLDTYAWILYKQEKYSEALKYIKLAFENGGADNAEIIDHYGDILFATGEKENAIKYWKTARDLGKDNVAIDAKIQEAEK